MIDISPFHLETIKKILRKYVPDCEVRAFGSRVTWTAKDYSDLDLTIVGQGALSKKVIYELQESFQESDLPFRIDILDWHTISNEFQALIEKKYEMLQEPIKEKSRKFKETEIGTIPEDWKLSPLTNVVCHIVDNRGKSAPLSDDGIALIATNCIKEEGLYPTKDKIRFVSQATYQTWFRYHPKPHDIIIVNKGTPGLVCMVPDPVDFCIAQDMVAIRADEENVYGKYLFTALRSKRFKHQVDGLNVGTTIPHLKKTLFPKLLIPIPSNRKEQESIGNIYYSLSEKIELNIQMNKTLEDIGQALFKQWFVDFEFPDENGNPYKSSGGKMIDSALGEIPKGWEVGKFSDYVNVLGGGTPKTNITDYWNGAIPFFTPKDYSNSCYVLNTEKTITEEGLKSCNSKLYPINTIFITARGTVGKICMAGLPMAMNQSCYALNGKGNINQFYLLNFLLHSISKFLQATHGSVFETITTVTFSQIEFLKPNDRILEIFEQKVSAIYDSILKSKQQIITLSQIRDSLLPRLMSGLIRVEI